MHVDSPIGALRLLADDTALVSVYFSDSPFAFFVLANAVLGESERFPVELRCRVARPQLGGASAAPPQTPHRGVRKWAKCESDHKGAPPTAARAGAGHPVLARARAQLAEYFAGDRTAFDLPLRARGTAFQERVWTALAEIPYGETRSYATLARDIGRPAAMRATGAATGRNPLSIVVPCHRVVGSDGSLTGYAGGTARKEWLLRHERAVFATRDVGRLDAMR